jgi:hypothetical protein
MSYHRILVKDREENTLIRRGYSFCGEATKLLYVNALDIVVNKRIIKCDGFQIPLDQTCALE